MSTLDPTLDVVFKLLFGSPESRDVLIALLTAILDPPTPIQSVTVLNPEVSKADVADKGIVLDLRVVLADGLQVDVEMQARRRGGFRRRALFYRANLYAKQLVRGEQYTALSPVVLIVFAGYRELEARRLHSTFQILEKHGHERFSDGFELHLVELPKLTEPDDQTRQEVRRWAEFLAARSDEQRRRLAQEDPMVEQANEMLGRLSADESVRALAEERELALNLRRIELGEARAEARTEGRTEGRTELFLRLLRAKFGQLPSEVEERVREAPDHRIDSWAERLLTASCLDEVFVE